ncbi:transglutaminase family protein [Phormidium sp. LEGE 05292]|uniref:transglutaminase family protein n=1 Tax=[Phormidium] sp. LEGE 05292 TaxID=767427 RepID=UPI0018809BB6|nr:transglutaminase family protein [Phormidium sp. LEGE 05292]MBE9228646.1 transglutaminase family protein [Phormidium sp. LEGE 05292]
MLYHIVHTTTYNYQQAVTLKPHTIRLIPRSDAEQKVHNFSLEIDPKPTGICYNSDLEGNVVLQTWFNEPTKYLEIQVSSQVETLRSNPFDYLLKPFALKLPIDYSVSLLTQLSPYLQRQYPGNVDPIATELAQEILVACSHQTTMFLNKLNLQIYENCEYVIRETGDPLPAGITWKQKSGSCRDFAVLFMEVCRAVGLAARFVSGYQEGDPDQIERDLHAWVEVYLPGAGWRGYDPTHGLAVSDRHIPLVASAFPNYTAPISGSFSPPGTSFSMTPQISIQFNHN